MPPTWDLVATRLLRKIKEWAENSSFSSQKPGGNSLSPQRAVPAYVGVPSAFPWYTPLSHPSEPSLIEPLQLPGSKAQMSYWAEQFRPLWFLLPLPGQEPKRPVRHFPRLQLLLLLTVTTVLVTKPCQRSSSQVNYASLLKGRAPSVFLVEGMFFLRIHSHSHPHTLTHSLEELISFLMLSPYVPLPSSGQLLEKKRLSPQRDPRMVGVGGWGGEGGKRKSC